LFRGLTLIMGGRGSFEKDLDKGLSNLKSVTEELAGKINGITVSLTDVEERTYVGYKSKISMGEMTSFFEEHFTAIGQKAGEAGLELAGMPAAIYYDWNQIAGTVELAGVMPVAVGSELEGYESFNFPAGKALTVDHFGPYENIGNAHLALEKYMSENNIEYIGPALEEYLNDPTTVEPDKIHTKLTYYVKA